MDGRVHETDQGFEAVADASIDTALSATRMVFSLLDIELTAKIEDSGGERTARGYSEERDVEVSVILEGYAPGATRVSVTAQVGKSEDPSDYEGDVDVVAKPANPAATDNAVVVRRKIEFWDKRFARVVLDRILEFTGLAAQDSRSTHSATHSARTPASSFYSSGSSSDARTWLCEGGTNA